LVVVLIREETVQRLMTRTANAQQILQRFTSEKPV
jgi:hypothetical protein